MAFYSRTDSERLAVLACDGCQRVLATDGSLSAKPFDDMAGDELTNHLQSRDGLVAVALQAGWHVRSGSANKPASWLCSSCVGTRKS